MAWPAPDSTLHLRRLAGDRWENLPAIPLQGAPSAPPRLTLASDRQGKPLIAFAQGTLVHVLRWDGARYEDLTPAVAPPRRNLEGIDASVVCPVGRTFQTDIAPPSLVVDADGHPVLAWVEPDGKKHRLVLTRHDGRAWETSSFPAAASIDPCMPHGARASLSLDPQGEPLVLVQDGIKDVRVLRKKGAPIEALPGVAVPGEIARERPPVAAFDGGGQPWLAFHTLTRRGFIFAQTIEVGRLEGTKWKASPTLAIPEGAEFMEVLGLASGDSPALSLHQPDPRGAGARVRVLQWQKDVPFDRAGSADGDAGIVVPGARRLSGALVAVPPGKGPVSVAWAQDAGLGAGSWHVRRFIDGA